MRSIWMAVGAALTLVVGGLVWAVMTHAGPAAEGAAADGVNSEIRTDALLESGLLHFRHRDLPQAKAAFEHVLALDPENKLAWYNLGVLAQDQGRRSDAHRAYDAALKADSAYPSALFNKALLLKASDPDKALGLLRRAVAADPKASTAHFHIGEILARKGREDEARNAYHRAVGLDPALRSQVPAAFRPASGESAEAAVNSDTEAGSPR
ncbi:MULTISPECIES: tetratricopeptide repeat protein [Streptomyces]|uniref:Tetratricopeptide repeat protein n=1 Tax=Streptomyces tsukubensis (strain DSM 42081 / NBRC 108919 / NRRL 18488 / 9993) TaxID=1114943 RepID=A0A7G3U9L8_STRT9|nr:MULTISPECIES: tetratricopeptide repeat protein [Streptomyces]AZK96992.1 hypothetical protein B7R87_26320 [Streptomyces tsukubensis]MYS66573.1 tetratricopeptide repeat protein [Streptomyces sp. SID5473]QKM67027.1 tetratricopeptide repeat protein [Streptomyces tsukubensis NRRL18488]TAI41494.1 tetratricopeptide repeat protein [Streptomyces tsukubensis]